MRRLLALIAVAALLGCALTAPAAEPPTPTAAPTATRTPTPTAVPTKPPPAATPEPVTLNPEGPWVVFHTSAGGLYALNPDGTALTPIVEEADRMTAPAIGVGRVAFITYEGDFVDLTLHIAALPAAEVVEEIALFGEGFAPEAIALGDPAFEAGRAMTELRSLAWSPDGARLAFLGAIDGPTADVYVYEDGEVTRWTDGELQAIRPTWSPDGRWVVHGAITSLGTGAGFGFETVFAAEGASVQTVFRSAAFNPLSDALGNADELFDGWAGDDVLVAHSADTLCGDRLLRTHNLTTGAVTVRYEGYFHRAVLDPTGRTALVVVPAYSLTECNSRPPGIYLVDLRTGAEPRRLLDLNARVFPVWAGAYVFTAGESTYVISADGVVEQRPSPSAGLVAVADGAGRLAWFSTGSGGSQPGLWLGDRRLTEQPVSGAAWLSDGTLLALAGGDLVRVSEGDLATIAVGVGVSAGPPWDSPFAVIP